VSRFVIFWWYGGLFWINANESNCITCSVRDIQASQFVILRRVSSWYSDDTGDNFELMQMSLTASPVPFVIFRRVSSWYSDDTGRLSSWCLGASVLAWSSHDFEPMRMTLTALPVPFVMFRRVSSWYLGELLRDIQMIRGDSVCGMCIFVWVSWWYLNDTGRLSSWDISDSVRDL